jgi:hypothetical protein
MEGHGGMLPLGCRGSVASTGWNTGIGINGGWFMQGMMSSFLGWDMWYLGTLEAHPRAPYKKNK